MGDGGVLKIARRIWQVGVAGWRGAFSTLLRRPGLRASSYGVLATKSERKMLVSVHPFFAQLTLLPNPQVLCFTVLFNRQVTPEVVLPMLASMSLCNMCSLDSANAASKLRLDWFSGFCAAHGRE